MTLVANIEALEARKAKLVQQKGELETDIATLTSPAQPRSQRAILCGRK